MLRTISLYDSWREDPPSDCNHTLWLTLGYQLQQRYQYWLDEVLYVKNLGNSYLQTMYSSQLPVQYVREDSSVTPV
jgi:hypothetical protein